MSSDIFKVAVEQNDLTFENLTATRRSFVQAGALGLLTAFFGSSARASFSAVFEPVSSISYTFGDKKLKLDIGKCKEQSDVSLFSHLTLLSMAYGLELKDEFQHNSDGINLKIDGRVVKIESLINRFDYTNEEQAKLQLLTSAILASVQKTDGAETVNDNGFANLKVRDLKLVRSEFVQHARRLEECMLSAIKERASGLSENTGATRQLKSFLIEQLKSGSGGYFNELSAVVEACLGIDFGPSDARRNPFLAKLGQTFLDFAVYNVGWSKMYTNFVDQSGSLQVTLDKDSDARLFALGAAYFSLFPAEKLPEVTLVWPSQVENQLPSYCVKYSKSKFIFVPLSYLVGLDNTANLEDLKMLSFGQLDKLDNNAGLNKAISDNLIHAIIASHGFKSASTKELSKLEPFGVVALNDFKKVSQMGTVLRDTEKHKSGKQKPSLSQPGWYS